MSPTASGVITDHVTVLGNGTAAQPLHTGDVPVTADGTTILGNGTIAHPLHSGDVPVTADGTTILGNGTTGNPLRQSPGLTPQEFTAEFTPGTVLPGTPVFLSTAPQAPGNPPFVNSSSAAALSPDVGVGKGKVNGIVKSGSGSIVQVQPSGLVTLTTAQWDAVTGGSGGLVMGTTYYTAQFPAVGKLTDVRPVDTGILVSKVGVGLNSTTLLLAISPAIDNQGAFALDITNGILGNAVAQFGSVVSPAVSDVNLQRATAIGVATLIAIFGITQTSGLVTLTPTQWAAITDTGGLVGSFTYYVDTSAHPGRLTAIEPSTGFAAQVGVALNTTTLILSTPCFPLVF